MVRVGIDAARRLFVAVQLTPKALTLLAHHGFCLRGLTFELSGRRRQDAKPGLVKMYEYHQPGLGGLPLVLRLSEGLGRTRKTVILFD